MTASIVNTVSLCDLKTNLIYYLSGSVKPMESRNHDCKERNLPHTEQSFLQRESARTTTKSGCLGPCRTADFAPSDFHHFPNLKEYLNENSTRLTMELRQLSSYDPSSKFTVLSLRSDDTNWNLRYVSMYVRTYVCTYVRMYLSVRTYIHKYVRTYVCMYVCTYVCITYICTYVCIFVCMYVRTYVGMYLYMYVCM
jgi:hypothetical protein